MTSAFSNSARVPVGQAALHQLLLLDRPSPFVQSYVIAGARRTVETEAGIEEYYPPSYATGETLLNHVRFALRYEPFDIGIIYAALEAIGTGELEEWLREEPTGSFSRRAWFLYETFSRQTLDVEPARSGNYVDALDNKFHVTATPFNSPRHRVRDNLLGNAELCPMVRRTRRLETMQQARLNEEAQNLTNEYAPETLARAINYLYTKETRSSFALEGEIPSQNRLERFLQALHRAPMFNPTDKDAMLRLQASIVDPRYAAQDWRNIQNFVGETTQRFGELVHFICPRPQDVPSLMQGWMTMTKRLFTPSKNRAEVAPDAVIAAAVSAFAFVFIHPFEDGNGRIHRFMIHAGLSQRHFSPPGVLFPVSAAILRNKGHYEQALEAFSKAIQPCIEWEMTEDGGINVQNNTHALYRFFDATQQAEYLYDRVAETIRIDFREELDFLTVYDAAFTAVQEIVDMPDRRLALLVRLLLQNGGRLSQNKRKSFAELTDEEIFRMERAVQRILSGETEAEEET